MTVIWVNGAIGAGKTAVGRALAGLLSGARFLDGDDHAGPRHLPARRRWRMATDALLRAVALRAHTPVLVIAYPLDPTGYRRLRTVCGRSRRRLMVVTLATPLPIILRGRGGRGLSAAERARTRRMHAEGYHRRRFPALVLPNASGTAARTARLVVRRLRRPCS